MVGTANRYGATNSFARRLLSASRCCWHRDNGELVLPLGHSKTSPISAVDVARAVSVILDNPAPHIGQVYNLTGFESADLDHYAHVLSEALGRTIRYRAVLLSGWTDTGYYGIFGGDISSSRKVVSARLSQPELLPRGR